MHIEFEVCKHPLDWRCGNCRKKFQAGKAYITVSIDNRDYLLELQGGMNVACPNCGDVKKRGKIPAVFDSVPEAVAEATWISHRIEMGDTSLVISVIGFGKLRTTELPQVN